MADIYISYAKEDRVLAEKLAADLEAAGYTVWWDHRDLAPGVDWQREIRHQLSAATAVVALWSQASVKSDWVRTVASMALADGKLIPVKTDWL